MPSCKILGLSAFYHDSAACLVRDGDIVAAAQEERFTRKKHDANFPRHAIDYCLAAGSVRIDQVDLVALRGEGKGIDSGGATHVKDYGGWRRKMPSDNRLGSKALQLAPLVRQALRFLCL